MNIAPQNMDGVVDSIIIKDRETVALLFIPNFGLQ